MNEWQQRLLSNAADALCTAIPRRRPDAARLAGAKLLAHRGTIGIDGTPAENTLAAFEHCLALGLFGVELDVQWTADGVPVVIHDADTARVFDGPAVRVAGTAFEVLRARFPDIPALDEVVARFGGRLHLMIELKADTYAPRHLAALRRCLADLEGAADYHLLSLEPDLLAGLDGIERRARMAVAETNTRDIAAAVRRLRLGAMAGHYLLVDAGLRREFTARGIRYGVGMVPSGNVLRRALGGGCEWIFTNHAARIAHALEKMRAGAGGILSTKSKPKSR